MDFQSSSSFSINQLVDLKKTRKNGHRRNNKTDEIKARKRGVVNIPPPLDSTSTNNPVWWGAAFR